MIEIDRVRVSTRAAQRAQEIGAKFPQLGVGNIHRIAALLSLRKNGFLSDRPKDIDSNTNRPARLSGPIEYHFEGEPILFPTILALITGRSLSTEEVYEQVWYHIHIGSEMLNEIVRRSSSIEELFGTLLKELPEGLNEVLYQSSETNPAAFSLTVGVTSDGSVVKLPLNDSAQIESPHTAIVGVSGQGKTQLVLDLLAQLGEQNADMKFSVLDYKGDLSQTGSNSRLLFEKRLGCVIVTAGQDPIPVLPFQRPTNQTIQQYSIAMADLLAKVYPRIGSQQKLALRQAFAELFSESETESGFGFTALEERLSRIYTSNNRREDGLTEVVSRLAALRVFEEKANARTEQQLVAQSTVIRLNDLSADSIPIAFLLVNRIYEEMRKLPDSSRQGALVTLRHLIFIDEAHHYLPYKSTPLSDIIREGRSKGVVVFLATQSMSDLAKGSSDYREFLSNVVFFKTNISSVNDVRALIPGSARKAQQVAELLPQLGPGQMIFTRYLQKEPRACILQAEQFYKRPPVV